MWKQEYRVISLDAAIPAAPLPIEVIGYAPPATPFSVLFTIALGAAGVDYIVQNITSLSRAIQTLSSSVHRWNALGRDAVGVVLGMPVGSDPGGSLAPLPVGAQTEQQYAHLDIPSRDLKHAISQANKTAVSSSGIVYGTDYGSDLGNIALV